MQGYAEHNAALVVLLIPLSTGEIWWAKQTRQKDEFNSGAVETPSDESLEGSL